MSIFNPSDFSDNFEIIEDITEINDDLNVLKTEIATKADSNAVVTLNLAKIFLE